MDGWVDGQMEERKERKIGEQIDGGRQIGRQMMDRQLLEKIGMQVDRQIKGSFEG